MFLFYLVASGLVIFVFVARPGIDGNPRAMFTDAVYGAAHKPYVYRTLLPTTVRVISSLTPEQLKQRVNADFWRRRTAKLLNWNRDHIYDYMLAILVMWLCFLGFAYALRSLLRATYRYPPNVTDFAPLVGLLAIPLLFRYYSYLYDPSNLFLFTLCIVALYKRSLIYFYALFVLATLNKETSILLVALFVAHNIRREKSFWLGAHALALISIWVAVKAFLFFVFRHNPGTFVELHLGDHNLRLLSQHPFSTLYLIVVFFVSFLLVRSRWSQKPLFLRQGLLITVIPLVAGALFFGFVDELRGYYEAFPFLFLLALPTVGDIFDISQTSTPESNA
ncbi:MAG: hypothetical protein JSW58_13020 [Candidatus Latescibacterota bacterium]|nr:MAG: hypothetical protein JSW58_13020 [Candidatus Latescibacterota bacterium]